MIVKVLERLALSVRKVQPVTVKVDTIPSVKMERVTLVDKGR
jgi:hypothetical protein